MKFSGRYKGMILFIVAMALLIGQMIAAHWNVSRSNESFMDNKESKGVIENSVSGDFNLGINAGREFWIHL